jgi:hypothetical protein
VTGEGDGGEKHGMGRGVYGDGEAGLAGLQAAELPRWELGCGDNKVVLPSSV